MTPEGTTAPPWTRSSRPLSARSDRSRLNGLDGHAIEFGKTVNGDLTVLAGQFEYLLLSEVRDHRRPHWHYRTARQGSGVCCLSNNQQQ